jgi:hypothetical protein
VTQAHVNDRLGYEVELHACKLELKAKVGIMQVWQSLIKPTYHGMQ